MQKLFHCDDPLVQNICNVVQFLLTNDFNSAKFSWLTSICGLSPNSSGLLNSFGTDKQLIIFHIKNIFQRNYNFTCSSENCPSQNHLVNQSGVVEDMTLHEPCSLDRDENAIAKSIKMWELGTSDAATISCKELFAFMPDHCDFICEQDKGENIIRCSGWRQPTDMSFVTPSPFLVFDISIIFRESIKTLDILPHEITVYNETYRLAGITSYIKSRRHYVGYILHNGHFLHYDGIPATNPVLVRYRGNDIEGDISLLCYFPREKNASKPESMKSNSKSPNEGSQKEKTSGQQSTLTNNSVNNTSSDSLLAKALDAIEHEEENIYARPTSKRYRRFPIKSVTYSEQNQTNKLSFNKSLQVEEPVWSEALVSSESDEENDANINMEMVAFINRKNIFYPEVDLR